MQQSRTFASRYKPTHKPKLAKECACPIPKLSAYEVNPMPIQGRDVKEIGHFGTGDFELTIKDMNDFEETKHLINEAYKNIGG